MISVCAICGDEPIYFRPWVEHLKKIFQVKEIIVLYNKKCPERIDGVTYIYHPDHYNFSEWRNASLMAATMPWILVLDIDEFLSYEFIEESSDLLRTEGNFIKAPRMDFWTKNAYRQDLVHQKYYLFRNDKDIFYTRPLHEELCYRHGKRIEDVHPVRLIEKEAKVVTTTNPIYHYSFIKRRDEGSDRLALYLTTRYVNNWDYTGDSMNRFKRENLIKHIKEESEKGMDLVIFEGRHPAELEGII